MFAAVQPRATETTLGSNMHDACRHSWPIECHSMAPISSSLTRSTVPRFLHDRRLHVRVHARSSPGRPLPMLVCASAGVQAASEAEEEANRKRWEESGEQGPVDKWRWTLNWDRITPQIIVGSCPRSPEDVDVLVREAGASAILSLQSDLCLEALNIDLPPIRRRAVRQGVLHTRVAVRDFDHNDQAAMLPEAVRMLHALLSMGRIVYVHCTAGINRATLCVVGYLTFVQGMSMQDAVDMVKTARPQAHPYEDCWKTVRARLVSSRAEEVMYMAQSLFKERKANGEEEDGFADWVAAENLLIRETFNRQLEATLSLVRSMQEAQEASLESLYCYSESEVDGLAQEINTLQRTAEESRAAMQRALEELAVAREELAMLRSCSSDGGDPEACTANALNGQQEEMAALRSAIKEVARKTSIMLQQPKASVDE